MGPKGIISMSQGDAFAPGDALANVEILYVDDENHRRDTMRKLLTNLAVSWEP